MQPALSAWKVVVVELLSAALAVDFLHKSERHCFEGFVLCVRGLTHAGLCCCVVSDGWNPVVCHCVLQGV